MNSTNIVYIDDNDATRARRNTVRVALDGPPIAEGSRNITLTRIAGRLHDGTRSLEELIEDLHAVNKARCKPPLSKTEVSRIAKSIYSREPCRSSAGRPPEVVIEFVKRHRVGVVEARAWKGVAGASDHKVYAALLAVAEKHGWMLESGNIGVSISVRDLALLAGVSRSTCEAAIKRLQRARLLYRIPRITNGKAGQFALRNVANLTRGRDSQSINESHGVLNVPSVRRIDELLRRFRHGPGRITPTQALHLRALVIDFNSVATVKDLATRLERRPDNVRRTMRHLAERGLVEELGHDTYRFIADPHVALAEALRQDGVSEIERAQRQRDEQDREMYAYTLALREAAKRGQDLEAVPPPAACQPVPKEGQVIAMPVIASTSEVYTPEVTVEDIPELVKNLPPIGEDAIYHHGSECHCWLCDEAAPEFIPVPEREATLAGVA